MAQENLAQHLRVLRAQRGLSLTEAAERIGVTRDTLSEIERGKRHPYMPTLAKIAQGYGVPVEELLEEPALAGKAEGRSAAEPSPEIDFSRVEDLIDLSRVDVESRVAAGVLVVSRDALVRALENVQGGVWSIEDAERALEREGRERLEQTYTVAFKQAYTDVREQLRGGVGKWSTS